MPSLLQPSSLPRATDDKPPRLSRSPQPYHWSSEQQQPPPFTTSSDRGYLPSPAPTPSTSDTEDDTRANTLRLNGSPDDSSTEVEDDGIHLVRALPAPPPRPRKGLRNASGLALQGELTPLLTPSVLHDEGRRLSTSYFDSATSASPVLQADELARQTEALQKFQRRRRAELLRRTCELLSLCSIAYIVFTCQTTLPSTARWSNELLWHSGSVCAALLLYPVRLLLHPLVSNAKFALGSVEIPATFDPAPLLYPPFLPVLAALSLSSGVPQVVLPNIILGLSALPSILFPGEESPGHYNALHWVVATLPISLSEAAKSPGLGPHAHTKPDSELLTLLFPLHQALLVPLHYLTTTSLLPSELQLLSISLINILLLSQSSQTAILRNVLWIGGLGLLFLCTHVLRWNVALERIPNWRFRRAGRVMASAKTFITSLGEAVSYNDGNRELHVNDLSDGGNYRNTSSSATKDCANGTPSVSKSTSRSRSAITRRARSISDVTHLNKSNSAPINDYGDEGLPIKKTNTQPEAPGTSPLRRNSSVRHKQTLATHSYSLMTPKQILIRKWGYALYTYVTVVALILVPIRISIGSQALNHNEPFGWAIGYLFGDLPGVAPIAQAMGIDSWIALPRSNLESSKQILKTHGWIERYRHALGSSTTRLLLFAYWAAVIAVGLMTVLFGLRGTVEVDTRRKVFHGMMVVMLLPSTYIDPCFLALGLSLVLAVFLLLDLFRAAQLKPLSKPLASFLAPYVDGRDLRGPVVVSHIFLLIGCAIPLWLSLASVQRRQTAASDPWKGWELETRDVSMVAGVVCVGMGDAAASLVGRRFGRRKWPWAGGKSLEGSTAFAAAVTVGLLAGRAWVDAGGWTKTNANADEWLTTVGKAVVAASGASFTEAVLTGANDNVVVPVVLWLLVRGLGV